MGKITEGMKQRLRDWLLNQPRQKLERQGNPNVFDMLHSTPVVTVWAISNGYLITGSMGLGSMGSAVTYAKDLSEIGDQIAAMKARVAIGVPSEVRMPVAYNQIGSGNR